MNGDARINQLTSIRNKDETIIIIRAAAVLLSKFVA